MSAPVRADIDPCPYCGATTGVRPMAGTSPGVSAWSCAVCGTQWAISSVRRQPYCDRLAAAVQRLGGARSILREVIALTGETPGLGEDQLRTRLVGLGDRASRLMEGEAR
jgi:ribosomal protein L37AE/L43A